MQLKANTVYYPMQPIQGNAGNPVRIDQTGDNWNFIELILLANGYLFSTNTPMPRINTKNFAVNQRLYDTTNKKTLYPNVIGNINTVGAIAQFSNLTLQNCNFDTAMGQSWFH